MKPTVNINNKYFMYTITGVVLLIGALGFTLTNFSKIAMLDLTPTLIVSTLGLASFSLLSKAVKADKDRMGGPTQA